jgi:hypothetical protein
LGVRTIFPEAFRLIYTRESNSFVIVKVLVNDFP